MKPSRRLAPFAAILAATCAVAPPARAQTKLRDLLENVAERHLDNGLTVIVQEDHRAPIVSLTLRYDFGAGAMPAGREGVARVTTFLMVDRSEHARPGEALRLFARAGASKNSDSTGQLAAVLSATVPAHELSLPLWVWSDQMGFFDRAVDDAAVASQRARIIALRRAALDGQRLGRLDHLAEEELFPDAHPEHFSAQGPESVERVDRASVVAFHDAWITPDHAKLSIVGDVEAATAFALARRYFGSIPRSAQAERPRWEAPPPLLGESLIDVAADVPAASISVRWPTARLLTVDDARLDVVARLFKSNRTSWLAWRLVDARKVATDVQARQRAGIAGSQFEVTVEGAPGKTPDELLAALDAAMDEVRVLEPSPGALQGAVYEVIINRLVGLEQTATRAAEYARFSALAGAPGYLRRDLERYQAVTPASVRAAIAEWLPRDRRVVLSVTPTKGASPGGDRIRKRFIAARTP